jgi:hypothetical protein
MKSDWLTYFMRSCYTFFIAGALFMVGTWRKWPDVRILKVLSTLAMIATLVLAFFSKREQLQKEALIEQIRVLSTDLTLRDEETIDDFKWLFGVNELAQIVAALETLPSSKRQLQAVIDRLNLWSQED